MNYRFIATTLSLSALTFSLGLVAPTNVYAQQSTKATQTPEVPQIPMETMQGPQEPYTESVAMMVARDQRENAEILAGKRPPRMSMAKYHEQQELEERLEETMRASMRSGTARNQPRLKGTPYLGAIDASGHMLASSQSSASLVNSGKTLNGGTIDIGRRPPQTLSTGFAGPSLQTMATTLGFYNVPPDTQGAIGPNHVMFMANGIVQIYSRAGVLASSVSLDAFCTATISGTTYPRGGSFDPRVVYDRTTGKWFATGMEFGVGQVNNGVILMVSRTNDPTGTWDKYFINMGTASAFTDYSTLGVDANGVYMAATIFPASGSSTTMTATPKASLIFNASTNPTPTLGTVSKTTGIAGFFGTPHPAQNLDNSVAGSRAWIIGARNSTAGGLAYRKVSWSGATPTIDAANTNLTIGGAVDYPLQFAPSSSTLNVDTGDFRLQQAFIRNNSLYCSRTVGTNSAGVSVFGSGTTRSACEWFQLGVSTTTATATQSGRVFDAGATPRNYFYPSLGVNGQGQVAMTMSGATTGEFISTYTCGRLPADTTGTMQGILQTKAGTDQYTVTFIANNAGVNGDNRFGDYSFTMVDPNDDQSIWGFQEFAATRGSATNALASGIVGNWQLWAQKLLAPAPTATAPNVISATPGQVNVSLPITGTGLFDPGTGFPNRLSATVSGTGVTVNNVSYTNATTASVNFSVAATAATGLRDVTITNPDGQSAATIVGAINIKAAAPAISVTRTITNTGSAWRVAFTLTNTGGSNATSVRVLTSLLGTTAPTTALPVSVGTIAPGATAVVNLDYPITAATTNNRVVSRVAGDYTGGTFSSAVSVTP
jgi:hypothetical protein